MYTILCLQWQPYAHVHVRDMLLKNEAMYCYALCTQSGHDIGSMYIDIDSDHTEFENITDTLIQNYSVWTRFLVRT